MTLSRAELSRRRRCLVLQVGIALGVFLLATERNWIANLVVAVGIVVLVATWWRRCRGGSSADEHDSV